MVKDLSGDARLHDDSFERHKSCQPHAMPVPLAPCRKAGQNHGKLAAVYSFEREMLSK
jgi:hypothetical protein